MGRHTGTVDNTAALQLHGPQFGLHCHEIFYFLPTFVQVFFSLHCFPPGNEYRWNLYSKFSLNVYKYRTKHIFIYYEKHIFFVRILFDIKTV